MAIVYPSPSITVEFLPRVIWNIRREWRGVTHVRGVEMENADFIESVFKPRMFTDGGCAVDTALWTDFWSVLMRNERDDVWETLASSVSLGTLVVEGRWRDEGAVYEIAPTAVLACLNNQIRIPWERAMEMGMFRSSLRRGNKTLPRKGRISSTLWSYLMRLPAGAPQPNPPSPPPPSLPLPPVPSSPPPVENSPPSASAE